MKKKVILMLVCMLTASQVMASHKISGIMLPDRVHIEKHELLFNGAGVFRKSFKGLLVCALYLEEKNRDAIAIIHADKPMSMRFYITSGLVTKEKLLTSLSGTPDDQGNEIGVLQRNLKELAPLFQEEIHRGDIIEVAYLPEKGTQISHNGEYLASIKGLDSKEALFALWLGEKPVDNGLKRKLLAQAPVEE